MPEPVHGAGPRQQPFIHRMRAFRPHHTLGTDEGVLTRQRAAQGCDDLGYWLAGQFGHKLGGEVVALRARSREKPAAVFGQAFDSLGDRGFDVGRQVAPVERLAREPTGPPRL